MDTKQLPIGFSEEQAAIYGVALSLDAFLVNGIQYGVLRQALFPEFLQNAASALLSELARLEEQGPRATTASQPRAVAALRALRTECQQLIDQIEQLRSFAAMQLQQLRDAVSQVLRLRGGCVQRIQELEASFRTPTPFYQSRRGDSASRVDDFLANLDHIFAEEWASSNPALGEKGSLGDD
jgi:hypothetical protein